MTTERFIPDKLMAGDEVRVVAPARSLAIISEENRRVSDARFREMGLRVSFGKRSEQIDDFMSSPIASRVDDLHEAFDDKNVKAILTVIGGFNSNQILRYLDWNFIASHPKILCGFSDITALNNSIYAKSGLVTYSGPHYSTFAQRRYFDYTLGYFNKCLVEDRPFEVKPSEDWSDDAWYADQEHRNLIKNDGWLEINKGTAEGVILGANLSTFNLLQGTEYFPNLEGSVLFLEDYEGTNAPIFDRDLQSLIHTPAFVGVKGLVIGRFQKVSKVTNDLLVQIIKTKEELSGIPVLANVDFGHTDPKITFPIGGTCSLRVEENSSTLQIIEH